MPETIYWNRLQLRVCQAYRKSGIGEGTGEGTDYEENRFVVVRGDAVRMLPHACCVRRIELVECGERQRECERERKRIVVG